MNFSHRQPFGIALVEDFLAIYNVSSSVNHPVRVTPVGPRPSAAQGCDSFAFTSDSPSFPSSFSSRTLLSSVFSSLKIQASHGRAQPSLPYSAIARLFSWGGRRIAASQQATPWIIAACSTGSANTHAATGVGSLFRSHGVAHGDAVDIARAIPRGLNRGEVQYRCSARDP